MTPFDARSCFLGEGAFWHPLRQQFFWFDVLEGRLLSRDASGPLEWRMGRIASAAGWVDQDRLLIATETGLEHRLAADGQRVTGIYRRSLMLASGRFAMLDDGMGFSLVPWTPVIEQRLGMLISGQVHGGTLSWQIRRQQGLSVT